MSELLGALIDLTQALTDLFFPPKNELDALRRINIKLTRKGGKK